MQKIKVGIVSYGMSGLVFHGPLLKTSLLYEVEAILERTKDISAKDFGAEKIVRSFADILSNKVIELVIINTPDHTHYAFVKEALLAGKHVVVEKPFVQEPEHGEELIALAKKQGLILTVFQNRRWDSDFLTIQQVINDKLLGRLVEFESHFDRYRNYIQPDTWKEEPESGTGITYNLGSHLIDQALCLFGRSGSIHADIRAMRTGSKVDDFFDIDLFYPDVKVKLKSSYLVKEAGPRFILHGTEGSFVKYGIDPQEEDLKNGRLPNCPDWGVEDKEIRGLLNTTAKNQNIKKKLKSIPGNYPGFYQNLYVVLREGVELAVKPEEALQVIRLIKAAFTSSAEGIRVKT